MNNLLPKNTLELYSDLQNEVLAVYNPFHEKREDARMKWVGVISAYKSLDIQANTLLDLGSGPSSLPLYFKQTVPTVIANDINFPACSVELLQQNGVQVLQSNTEDVTDIAPGSIDVITDSCAVGCSMNLDKVLELSYSWLRPGGYFITTGDSCITNDSLPFPSPDYWCNAAQKVGFQLVGSREPVDHDAAYQYRYNDLTLHLSRLIFQKPV